MLAWHKYQRRARVGVQVQSRLRGGLPDAPTVAAGAAKPFATRTLATATAEPRVARTLATRTALAASLAATPVPVLAAGGHALHPRNRPVCCGLRPRLRPRWRHLLQFVRGLERVPVRRLERGRLPDAGPPAAPAGPPGPAALAGPPDSMLHCVPLWHPRHPEHLLTVGRDWSQVLGDEVASAWSWRGGTL